MMVHNHIYYLYRNIKYISLTRVKIKKNKYGLTFKFDIFFKFKNIHVVLIVLRLSKYKDVDI